MRRFLERLCLATFAVSIQGGCGFAQKAVTRQEGRDKFEAADPTLQPRQIGVKGEGLDRQLEVDRNERPIEATREPVLGAVDAAYRAVTSRVIRLEPEKDGYLQQATPVRDTIKFSYQRRAASLGDSLNAQAGCRSVQVNRLNSVASYAERADRLGLATEGEAIP